MQNDQTTGKQSSQPISKYDQFQLGGREGNTVVGKQLVQNQDYDETGSFHQAGDEACSKKDVSRKHGLLRLQSKNQRRTYVLG